jgi:ankyrin repeat protein
VLQLLEGANLNQRNLKGESFKNFLRIFKGHTALMRAAMGGHALVVSSLAELVEDKTDLDMEDTIGKTALHWAGKFSEKFQFILVSFFQQIRMCESICRSRSGY